MRLFDNLAQAWNRILLARPRKNPYRFYRKNFLDAWFSEKNVRNFLRLYYNLRDEESREVLLKLVTNTLTHYYNDNGAECDFYTKEQWDDLLRQASETVCILDTYPHDIIETFALEGYRYGDLVAARPGDIVLNCGAYTGNTSLYFSRRVGCDGRVYSFEAEPKSFSKLSENLKEWDLENVTPCHFAIADKTGTINFDINPAFAYASRVGAKGVPIPSTTIDDFVATNDIKKVDFIKMDIEGAEMGALNGAKETCRKFGPDLAVCVYHKATDLVEIPAKIWELSPNYRFYLRHNSNSFWDTVLFAKYEEKAAELKEENPDEAKAIAAWWEIVKNTATREALGAKREILELAFERTMGLKPLPVEPVFGGDYYYVKIPVSMDQQLHYEFLFQNSRMEKLEIALHFEGKYEEGRRLIPELIEKSELAIPLSERGRGCAYILDDAYDYKTAGRLMAYLISISMPLLKKNRMIDNLAFFEN